MGMRAFFHEIPRRHSNSGFGQESLGLRRRITILALLITLGKTQRKVYYLELAAMGGDVDARHKLGALEENVSGDMNRAAKHWMSAGAGHDYSLKAIRPDLVENYNSLPNLVENSDWR